MTKIKKFFLYVFLVVLGLSITLGMSSLTLFVVSKVTSISFTFVNVLKTMLVYFGLTLIKSTIKVVYRMSTDKSQS